MRDVEKGFAQAMTDDGKTRPMGAPRPDLPTLKGSDFLGEGPEAITAPMLAKGTVVGRYLLLEAIGEGGMGQVYAAYDPELNRKLAIKLLQAARDAEEDRARFMREGQAMARLSHPNVVAVHDVGRFGDSVFIAMDLVEGQTLNDWVRSTNPGWRQVTRVMMQAGRGLAAAHAEGIIHRDFKPQNVLVGAQGRVCVTDFGIATSVDSAGLAPPTKTPGEFTFSKRDSDMFSISITRKGRVVGTPGFMSPEQLLGPNVDPRSDQFSFCATFHEAVFGVLPFGGKSLQDHYETIERGQMTPTPADRVVPDWLRAALNRGLAAKPEARFPSMDALLEELERGRRRDGRGMLEAAGRRLANATRTLVRSEGTLRLARIRAGAALVFFAICAALGYGRGLVDWRAYVAPLAAYFAVAAMLAFGLRARALQALHAYLGPVADCAAICFIQLQSLPISPHPAGVAGWSLGLFVFIVALSALSFRRLAIALAALAGWVGEAILQRAADVGWGAVVSSAIVLVLMAGTMAWILARFDALIAARRGKV